MITLRRNIAFSSYSTALKIICLLSSKRKETLDGNPTESLLLCCANTEFVLHGIMKPKTLGSSSVLPPLQRGRRRLQLFLSLIKLLVQFLKKITIFAVLSSPPRDALSSWLLHHLNSFSSTRPKVFKITSRELENPYTDLETKRLKTKQEEIPQL